MFTTSTLSLSEIPSEKLEKWPIASSFDLLKAKQYYVKLQTGSFHLNRHTLGIQELEEQADSSFHKKSCTASVVVFIESPSPIRLKRIS